MSDIYDVNKYTDQELYNILDLVNPSDRELEAKIFHMINKYKNMQNESGNKLAVFFNNIYARFFEIVETEDGNDDEVDEPESASIVEKMDTKDAVDFTGNNEQKLVTVQNYIPSNINPLLNQIITRIISVDSQYRDNKKTTLATNFTFNLSETLHNVLAVRLNSIQIPKTWYTISKSYGANFFYLKGNSPGINDGQHDYKLEVTVGNYTSETLIGELNNISISNMKSTYTDACFGTTGFIYNKNTCKATFTLDYSKTFNESNFAISFPSFSYPIDGFNSKRYDSIPQILGFDTAFIPINYVTSNYIDSSTHPYNVSNNPTAELFELNGSNNFFKIVNYNGYDSSINIFSSRYISADTNYNRAMELAYNTITIQSGLMDGSHNRAEILSDFNTQLQNNTYLSGAVIEQIVVTDPSMVGYNSTNPNYYYKFTLPLNPFTNTIVENMKTAVIFPEDTNIWIGSQSCFQFDTSINEISTFKSNATTNISNYAIGNNVYFTMKCDASGYVDDLFNNQSSNNIRVNIASNPSYSLTEYINAINSSINIADVSYNNFFSGNTELNITNFAINSITENYLRMRFYIQKKFTTDMYLFDCSSDCYFNYLNFKNTNYDLSDNSSIISAELVPAPTVYNLQNGSLFRIYPRTSSNMGNKNADPYDVYLDCSKAYHDINYIRDVTYLRITDYDVATNSFTGLNENKLEELLNWSIRNWVDPVLQNKPLKNSSVSIQLDPSNNDYVSYYVLTTRLDLSINTELTYKDYSLLFTDNSENSWNNYLFLDASYSLNDDRFIYNIQNNIPFVTFTNRSTKIYGNMVTLYDEVNNYFHLQPITSGVTDATNANRIKIKIEASANGTSYTLDDIINEIQLQFDTKLIDSKYILKGSTITNNGRHTYIRINHSKIYNTSDYRLVFYDPYSFVRCFVGASSIKNTSWDTTIGWILGFRERTEYALGNQYIGYDLNDKTITYYSGTTSLYTYDKLLNIATIIGDTTVSVNLYNYFMIVLNDYVQNHLNDGLVGIAPAETAVKSSTYANRGTYTCDPVTGNKIFVGTSVNNNQNTANQIYAENQKLLSMQAKVKSYSSGPFVQDVFAIIPLGTSNVNNGAVYVETGSGLQKQERVYFGPVNLSRMNVQLVTDRGDTVDLNGSDWSCTFQCDQLYQNKNV